jgi:hypothetical protein
MKNNNLKIPAGQADKLLMTYCLYIVETVIDWTGVYSLYTANIM